MCYVVFCRIISRTTTQPQLLALDRIPSKRQFLKNPVPVVVENFGLWGPNGLKIKDIGRKNRPKMLLVIFNGDSNRKCTFYYGHPWFSAKISKVF